MFNRDKRARRRMAKVKPGNGSPLKPYQAWHVIYRSLFSVDLTDAHGRRDTYAIDVNYFWGETGSAARLYVNGVQLAKAESPAVFPVPGGRIEVETSLYGLKRMHLVVDDGSVQQLTPDPRTAEGRRAALAQRRPGVSRLMATTAVVVLLGGLVIAIPQLASLISHWDVIADRFGSFTSPIALPAWANSAVLAATIVAAIERALTLRNNWIIDADTFWFDM